jgi:asparagine synthase (glutamine-hydrolysing)
MVPASLLGLAFDYPAALGRRGKQKVVDFLMLLQPEQLPAAYRHLISLFDQRDTVGLYTDEFRESLRERPEQSFDVGHSGVVPYLNKIINLQFEHWLPDDILMKQDKMSMAHSIEARVPFLDHELVEYALRLPPKMKIRGGICKYALREYAKSLLPKRTVSRRKQPFYVPLENYYRHPGFQDMLHDTLSDDAIRSRGILRPEAVAKLRDSMLRGEFLHVKQVFSLMTLELWFRAMVDRRGVS